MATFQASGVVLVNGRPAANVAVSFALAGKLSPTCDSGRQRRCAPTSSGASCRPGSPTACRTSPRRRRRASPSLPARRRSTRPMRPCASRGRVATFAASGVVRVAEVIQGPGKPPGIPGVQISFMRVAGRLDVSVPPPSSPTPTAVGSSTGSRSAGRTPPWPRRPGWRSRRRRSEVRADVSSEFTGGSSTFGTSGRIVTLGGAPDPAVAIHVERTSGSGAVPAATATDGAGAYSLAGLDRASRYRITPLKPGATFDPPSRDVAFAANSFPVVLASFTRTTNLVVTGQVLTTGGAGLVGAVITFTRTVGTGAVPLPVTTTSNGEYHAAGLDAGTTYVVTVSRDQFSSAPTQLRAAAPGTTTLNLTAFPAYEVSGKVLDLELGDVDFQSLGRPAGRSRRGRLVPRQRRHRLGTADRRQRTGRHVPPTRVRGRRHVRRPGLRRRLRGLAVQRHLRRHRRGDRHRVRRLTGVERPTGGPVDGDLQQRPADHVENVFFYLQRQS